VRWWKAPKFTITGCAQIQLIERQCSPHQFKKRLPAPLSCLKGYWLPLKNKWKFPPPQVILSTSKCFKMTPSKWLHMP
jgi:hypothetical protein